MDDLTPSERTRVDAARVLDEYSSALTMQLAEEILRYKEEFRGSDPLHGSAPPILEKYYSVFNSISVAKWALNGKYCKP